MKIAIKNMSYSSLDNWIRKMYRDQVELIYLQFEMSIFLKSMISISTNYSLHTNFNNKLKNLFYHLLPMCNNPTKWLYYKIYYNYCDKSIF